MNKAFKLFGLTVALAGCAAAPETAKTAAVRLSLTDRVQAAVVETQQKAAAGLPDEIAGMKSVEPVADREKNQRGAGFTRVYTADDIVATVFVYNNQTFGVPAEITPDMETLMEKHLQEFQAMQDSGLYANVKAGTPKMRTFRWRGVSYQVLESDVKFTQRDEDKASLLVLGANPDLMTFVRIRYTYPKSQQAAAAKKQPVFTRTVFVALHDFAEAQKTPVAEQ